MAKGENPAKRSKRYARELKRGKSELTGKPLTKGQRSFRGGVLNERKWGASIHKHTTTDKDGIAMKLYATHYDNLSQGQKAVVGKVMKKHSSNRVN